MTRISSMIFQLQILRNNEYEMKQFGGKLKIDKIPKEHRNRVRGNNKNERIVCEL